MENKMLSFKELASNEEIAAKLTSVKTLEEMVAILAENGLELTVEELGEIFEKVGGTAEDGELSEDALEDVSGGAWWGVAIKVVYYGYKIYKAIKG